MTPQQYLMLCNALSMGGLVNRFGDRRSIQALERAGHIQEFASSEQGFDFSITRKGLRAMMHFVGNMSGESMDAEMIRLVTAIKALPYYAKLYERA